MLGRILQWSHQSSTSVCRELFLKLLLEVSAVEQVHQLYYLYTQTLLQLLSLFSRVRLCAAPWTAARQAPCPRDSPGKSTRVGCHSPLHQVIFPTQGSNPSVLHSRQILYCWATREANIYIHTSLLFKISFLFKSPQCIEFPVPYSRFSLVIYFIHMKGVFKLDSVSLPVTGLLK